MDDGSVRGGVEGEVREPGQGAALAPEHAGTPYELLKKADIAMYSAKAVGGGVHFYDPSFDTHSP